MPTKTIILRVEAPLHQAARIKSVKTGQSLQSVLSQKLQEWVREPDGAESKQKAKAGK